MKSHTSSGGRRLLAASAAILTAAGSVLIAGSAAFAAPVEGPVTEQNGSITVHKHLNPGLDGVSQNPDGTGTAAGHPLNGATFQVCTISGINLITGGNAAWQEVRDLGALAPSVSDTDTTIGTRNLTSCATQVTATVAGADGIAVFSGLPVGAYLVRETAAPANIVERSAPFVVTVPTPAVGTDAGKWLYDVHVYPKNQELDDPTKTIVNQAGNGVISGAPIQYRISQRVPGLPAGDEYTKFIVTDNLDTKLTPGDADDVTVSVNGTALDPDTDYSAVWADQLLTVTLLAPALEDLAAGDTVVVDFFATASTNGAITNTAVVNVNDLGVGGTPGKTTPPVVTRWGSVDLKKVNASDHTTPLSGAEFELWMGSIAGAGCAVATSGNTKIADVVSNASGVLGTLAAGVITPLPGLWVGDDAAPANDLQTRCYYLVETKAPAGFVLPATLAQRTTEFVVHPTAVAHVNATKAIDNTQQTVPQLPLTGAAAQTVLLGSGVALVALAGALFVLRRRKTAGL